MPFQSKRISLTSLGIDSVPGMEPGNYLRIGFDPLMGFPPCGFRLYRRGHQTGPTRTLDIPRLFTQNIIAPFRHGLLQDDAVAVFHRNAPSPVQNSAGGITLSKRTLGFSFRRTPFMPDSDPKVCEVRLRVSGLTGPVIVEAFDDRYDNEGFRRILVGHQQHNFGPAPIPQTHEFVLRADLISLVEIQAPLGARLLSFSYTLLLVRGWQEMIMPPEQAWGIFREMPLFLPTPIFKNATTSKYPTCPEPEFPRPVKEIVKDLPLSRLNNGFVPQLTSNDVHGEYDNVDKFFDVYLGPAPSRERFEALYKMLLNLEAVPPAQQMALEVTNPADTDEESTFAPMPMVLTGAVDYAFARLLGLAAIDRDPPPTGFNTTDYMVEAVWNGVSHTWITHDVFRGRDKELAQPEAPAASLLLDMTRPGEVKTNVKLEWHAPSGLDLLDRSKQFIGYHVFRRPGDPVGDQTRLTESKDDLTGVTTPDLLLDAEIQGEEPVPPTPANEKRYLDRPPVYATFQYGLQAQDLFGRRSKITWGPNVKVEDLVDPPPVSDLFAFYRDTHDPAQFELDARVRDILEVTGQMDFQGSALLISFRYPQASIEAVSGHVASFNVSYHHGRPNELLGTLAPGAMVGPPPAQATSPVLVDIELATATPVPAMIDGYAGERARGALESHAEFFTIESATRLASNAVRLRVRARRDYLPQIGEASLSIGRGGPGITAHPAFISPREPSAWTGFDLRHPQGSDDRNALKLSAVASTFLSPLPVGLGGSHLVISKRVEAPANLPEGETEIPTDWVYRVVVKNIELPLPEGLTHYPGSVTVQVVGTSHRRSELPAPAYVERRAYGAPPPLTTLASSEFVTASRPDFQGRIAVALSWPMTAGVQRYNVYRADVPTLLSELGADPQLATNLFENEANRAQVKLLGGQLASIKAFTLITPVPITPELDTETPPRHRWIDRVTAPREQSYLYRFQPISFTGDEAPWPEDSPVENENRDRCILVLQKNRDLLLAPAIYELEPLDRSVGVVIRDPASETVNGLRIYKSDQPSRVADVRTMTLIHGTIPFTHSRIQRLPAVNSTPARVRFVDEKVQVGVQYFYRVAFVDEFGNVSQASEPLAVTPRSFAPPQPPTLFTQRTATDTVALSWTATHNEGQVKAQRKNSGEGQWVDVTEFLSPTGNAVDNKAVGIVAHRLMLRDPKGRVVFSELVITEA